MHSRSTAVPDPGSEITAALPGCPDGPAAAQLSVSRLLVGSLVLAAAALCFPAAMPQLPNDAAGIECDLACAVAADGGSDAPEWSAGIAARIEQEEYRASPTARGLQAPNRAHNIRARFRESGIDVGPRRSADETSTWRLTWRTTRWGRADRLAPVAAYAVGPRAAGSRVTYAHVGLDEWYENRKEGLEQGFTVHERPSGNGSLIVAGELGGGLHPVLVDGADAIDLLDEDGARALRYGGLHVWDADGDELPAHLELDGTEVALVIADEGADYPLTIDPLLTTPSWTADGNQANAQFATSVATAGDVNGDGFSDVIVGAPQFDNGQLNEGRAFVYLGSAAGLSLAPAWTAESHQVSALFGASVGSAGDVNGDGFDDVIVGAYLYDNGQSDEGRAFVYLGSPSGLNSTPAWIAENNEAGSNLGYSVGTAGDVNGDGFSDVIVGAHFGDHGQADEGLAYVYHGSAAGLATSPAWTGESNQPSSYYGFSVGSAGDVNGDGFSDIVVGAPTYDNGQTDEGRAFVYHGSASGLAGAPSWTAESNLPAAFYGWSVSTAGDVDGDGFCDVIVGATQYGNGQANEGAAFVYRGSGLGLGATAVWMVEGGQSGAGFGTSVATAGDVNGDGFADVIVGAYAYDNGETNEGSAFIYTGSPAGLSSASYWSDDGGQGGALFGSSVGTAGDVNGDGYSDVIVGATGYDNPESNEGRAFVYHGSGDDPELSASWTAEGDEAYAFFGASVATAGDVNGDGFTDVIVGAPSFFVGDGRALVYPGSASGIAASPAWTSEGDHAVPHFGTSVASAGDVNGDGFSDVIVGAAYDDGVSAEGRAYVYLGSAAGLATSPAWTTEGDEAETSGLAVASAGDVNGDGFSDVIVGAPAFDNHEGRAYVYLGSPAGLASSPGWVTGSGQVGARFGFSVGTAGDVNGDGFSDVIVGAYSYEDGQTLEGRAYVYHGSASGLSTSPGWAAEGEQNYASFGRSVGTAGDVNGDGFSDVIVGAYGYTSGQQREGRAYVYLGSFAGLVLFPSWSAESDQANAFFGHSVGTAGDVNGDGFSDVIVGASSYTGTLTNEGRAYVYRGSSAGLAPLADWSPTGGQGLAEFGDSVGTAGDVNGDGFSDVIVGAVRYDNGELEEGRSFVYQGNRGDGLHRVPNQVRPDGVTLIHALGRSDSPSAFRLDALGRTPAGRGRVQLQYEVEPFGTPFDGAGLVTGPILDTGIPTFGVGSAVELSELVSGLNSATLYHWRLRCLADSPFFPRSPWFTLAANGSAEADLRTASATTGVGDPPPVVATHWFESIAPSPFSKSTELAYTLPARGGVRIAIYDVSGRQVVVLADGLQDAGRHTARWDGRSDAAHPLATGVYLARLEFSGRIESRRVVLIR